MNCIVCGKENNINKSKFCCNKCKQIYYYQKNKEQRTEYKKQYYQENKEEYMQRQKKWVDENRDKWNEYHNEFQRKQRAKLKEEQKNG